MVDFPAINRIEGRYSSATGKAAGFRLIPCAASTTAPSMNEVTRILSAIEQGDPHAAEQLLPLVYNELRRLAAHGWPTKSLGRRCRRQRWCTRPISGWSMWKRHSTGTARPFLCGRCRGHAADPGRQCPPQAERQTRRRMAASCRRCRSLDRCRSRARTCWRWTTPSTAG